MILEKQKEAQIFTDGESQESIGMSLDLDSAQILMQMLSKNLYSDAIGSTIRECASNALDSHRRAGVDKPIIVSFKANEDSNYEFSVEDFGIGLDHIDVTNIISKYGASTKREEANSLGMMGLGFKAPLAYTSSFYFVARKNNIERKYMMYEGEDTNTIDLLYTSPTTEANGVKVIIPVKYSDRSDFVDKIKEQLAYFESVYFDVQSVNIGYYRGSYNHNTEAMKNDFVIFRSDDFQYSEIATDVNLHICLDNVYYPLDFEKLGISRIELPIAMRFSLIDGIFPTPNREALRYTQEAKKTILAKLGKIANFFLSKYNDEVTDTDNIQSIFSYYQDSSRYVTLVNNNYNISSLLPHSTVSLVTPKLNGVELLDLQQIYEIKYKLVNVEYNVKYSLERGKLRDATKHYNNDIRIQSITDINHYIFADRISGNIKDYLKATLPHGETYKFIKKVSSFPLRTKLSNGNSYVDFLDLNTHPKSQWRQRIKELQYIQSLFTNKFINLDEVVIPKEWLDARKKQRVFVIGGIPGARRVKLQGEIVGKLAQDLERHVDGKNCKFVPETLKLEKIATMNSLFVYTNHENASKLDPLYHISNGRQKIRFITFSDREINSLEKVEIHNLIPLSKFMEGKNKPFRRIVTVYLINQLMQDKKHVFDKSDNLKSISSDLHNKLTELRSYRSANYCNGHAGMYEAMLEVANDQNLFDHTIYSTYLEIKALLERLKFVNIIMKEMSAYGVNKGLRDVLCDLFKYYKHRINYTNYKIKLNEELPSGEALEQEVINQLETI